jgi:hypothetical protein
MALPVYGQPISFANINTELGRSSTAQIGLNEAEAGTYVLINPSSSFSGLNGSTPNVINEWWSYNHSEGVINIKVIYESAYNVGNITSLEIVGSDGSGYPVTITSGTFPLTAVGQSVTARTHHHDGEYQYQVFIDDEYGGTYGTATVSFEIRLYVNNIGGGLDKLVATRNGTESICYGLDSPSGPGATQFGFSALNLGDNIVIEAKSGICP